MDRIDRVEETVGLQKLNFKLDVKEKEIEKQNSRSY